MKAAVVIVILAVAAISTPGLAHADENEYLTEMHKEYFTHSFTDGQLVSEARKVCDAAGHTPETSLRQMVSSDMGVSETAAVMLVTAAHVDLGC